MRVLVKRLFSFFWGPSLLFFCCFVLWIKVSKHNRAKTDDQGHHNHQVLFSLLFIHHHHDVNYRVVLSPAEKVTLNTIPNCEFALTILYFSIINHVSRFFHGFGILSSPSSCKHVKLVQQRWKTFCCQTFKSLRKIEIMKAKEPRRHLEKFFQLLIAPLNHKRASTSWSHAKKKSEDLSL
jgi:hypothetical protein